MPSAAVTRINDALNQVLQMPEIKQRIASADMIVGGGSPQQYAELIARERVKWGEIVRRSGARVD